MKQILRLIPFTLFTLTFIQCNKNEKDAPFGKSYNMIRSQYGAPIIHDYMQLKRRSDSSQYWVTPLQIQDTIIKGFHAEKGFYIHPDSILQEDDIFRKRISDSTFAYIGILTYGNKHKSQFRSVYYDTVCVKVLGLKNANPCIDDFDKSFHKNYITIEQADSILESWSTSRFR